MENRQTKLAEINFTHYSIFDVRIPLGHGEGTANAFKRLQEVIDKRETCTQHLSLTDSRHSLVVIR